MRGERHRENHAFCAWETNEVILRIRYRIVVECLLGMIVSVELAFYDFFFIGTRILTAVKW